MVDLRTKTPKDNRLLGWLSTNVLNSDTSFCIYRETLICYVFLWLHLPPRRFPRWSKGIQFMLLSGSSHWEASAIIEIDWPYGYMEMTYIIHNEIVKGIVCN